VCIGLTTAFGAAEDLVTVERDQIVVGEGQTLRITRSQTKCTSFEAKDHSRIIFAPDVQEWTLNAATATFGNDVTIDGHGKSGSPDLSELVRLLESLKASTASQAAGSPAPKNPPPPVILDRNGGNGTSGYDAVNVTIRVSGKLIISGGLKVLLDGGKGGNGNDGRAGNNGVDAIAGRAGTDGENGGNGGNGGDGGNGGNLFVGFGEGSIDGKIDASVRGGAAGRKGAGKKAGHGGKSRPKPPPVLFAVSKPHEFDAQPGGNDGVDGIDGLDGFAGFDGSYDYAGPPSPAPRSN
jgi:hypothetical protein